VTKFRLTPIEEEGWEEYINGQVQRHCWDGTTSHALSLREQASGYDRGLARSVLLQLHTAVDFHETNVLADAMLDIVDDSLTGDVWAVSEDICDLLVTTAETIPEPPTHSIELSQIPQKRGFVVLEKPLYDKNGITKDEGWGVMSFFALSWSLTKDDPAKWGSEEWMLEIAPWGATGRADGSQFYILPQGPTLIPLDFSTFFDFTGEEIDWHAGSMWLFRWLLALFAWSSGEVHVDDHKLNRQQIRQQARKGNSTTHVRTIKLRKAERAERGPAGTSDSNVTPHFRSGHWRWQGVGPGRAQSRLTWVRPSVVRADLVPDGQALPTKQTRVFTVDR